MAHCPKSCFVKPSALGRMSYGIMSDPYTPKGDLVEDVRARRSQSESPRSRRHSGSPVLVEFSSKDTDPGQDIPPRLRHGSRLEQRTRVDLPMKILLSNGPQLFVFDVQACSRAMSIIRKCQRWKHFDSSVLSLTVSDLRMVNILAERADT